jgi:AcrR family transcriptional regulator
VEVVRATRRTAGARPRGRAERVVEQVLTATAQELSEVGYAALRIEAVAARAGVNKTTVYRRWPSRAALVTAAIEHVRMQPPPETGVLEVDLVAFLLNTVRFAATKVGAGIIRVIQMERGHVELDPVIVSLRLAARRRRTDLVARAIARGDLPADTDPQLVADVALSFVLYRIMNLAEPPTEAELRTVVETIIEGVRTRAARATT